MPSAHGWMLLCLVTTGALHPSPPPPPRAKTASVVKGVALRGEPRVRPPHPEPRPIAGGMPMGLTAGLRF